MDLSERGRERRRLAEVRRSIERDRIALGSLSLGKTND
jgi:hypothetical protein